MSHLENHSQNDLTDQPKATASHLEGHKRLQQLRKAHKYPSDGGQSSGHQDTSEDPGETANDDKWQRPDKRPVTTDRNTGRAIAENGDFVTVTVNLANESTKDNPKLLGGMDESGEADKSGLDLDSWRVIKNRLNAIKNEFDAASKNKTGEAISARAAQDINAKLKSIFSYLDQCSRKSNLGDDYNTLTDIEDNLPKNAKETVFVEKIQYCLNYADYAISSR